MKFIGNWWILLLSFFSFSVMGATLHYKISGTAKSGLNGKRVMLFQFEKERVAHVDTAIVANSRFFFEGVTDTARYAVMSCGSFPDTVCAARLMLEDGNIDVALDRRSTVKGTPLNEIYQPYLAKYYAVYDSLVDYSNKTALDSLAQIENLNECRRFWEKLWDMEKQFIKENITNPLGISLFKGKYFDFNEDVFDEIYATADHQIKQDPAIINFVRWREKQKEKRQKLMDEGQKLNGTKYIDYTFRTPTGKRCKLSDYIGKSRFVLLDFWASWCGPCMEEQPLIKELYTKYKDKGLMVLGISFDDNDKLWKNAMTKIEPTWPQLCDLKGGNSGIKRDYRIVGIPHTVLIDNKGLIIASKLHGELLKNILEQLLKE